MFVSANKKLRMVKRLSKLLKNSGTVHQSETDDIQFIVSQWDLLRNKLKPIWAHLKAQGYHECQRSLSDTGDYYIVFSK
jgi:hypothetical protein